MSNNWPAARVAIELWKEHRSLPFLQSLPCTLHIIALEAILGLSCSEIEFPTDLIRQADGESTKGSTRLNACLRESTRHLIAFFRNTNKVGLLYLMPPFLFVAVVTVLNMMRLLIPHSTLLHNAWNHYYKHLASQFADPRWIRDFTLDVRPLLLTWLLLVPPVALIIMLFHTSRTVVGAILPKPKRKEDQVYGIECLRLRQRIDQSSKLKVTDFYNSPWFNPVVLLPFILGLPAMICLWIYWHLGIDPLLGYPLRNPQFMMTFVIIGLYISSLGWCLSLLFFRSYFTLPWNFVSTEYDIEVYSDMIKKLPVKGWFYDFLTLGARDVPSQILWKDMVSIEFSTAKLKTDPVQQENNVISFIRKLTNVYESVANKLELHSDYLEIKTKSRTISIRLWELTAGQKLQLYSAIRKHDPSIHLDAAVQHALVGSSILREPQYTEIWFNVLTNDKVNSREGDLQEGQTLNKGRYSIKSKLASGGQAVVYKALRDNGDPVVLKEFQLILGESIAAQIESAKDFENECAILGQLRHPSIIRSLDMFYEEGRLYLVLEHVEGKTLRQFVNDNGPLHDDQIINFTKQMCDILRYLHSQEPPVVHRDFTPDNLIVQPDGQLKLIDFSVAQRKKDKALGDCAGKHSYTPPEQFRGEACPQSDIYALGATMYFLATGKDPVPITTSELPVVTMPGNKHLSKIIRNATQLDLTQRYESADWLLVDLNAIKVAMVSDNNSVTTHDNTTNIGQLEDVLPESSPGQHGKTIKIDQPVKEIA